MYQPKNLTDEAQDSVSAALNRSDAPSSENEDAMFAQAPNSGTLAYHNVLLNGYSAIDDHVGMFPEAETVWQPESNSVLPPHLLGFRQEGPSTGHDPMMNANANPNLANQLQPSDLAWMSIPSSSYSRPALQPTFGIAPGLHHSLPALSNTLLSTAPNDPKCSSRSVQLAREVSLGDSSNALNSPAANSYASDVTQPRLCSTCGTSDSPEWRRGADGRKTLCNACGLRHSRNESRIRRQQEKDRIVDEYVAGGGILYPQAAKSSQKPRERSSSHPSLSETSKRGITHVNNDIQRKSLPSESAEIQDELRPIDLYVDYQTAAATPSNKSHEKQ